MDAGSGRALQGRYLAPGPVAWRNKRREPRSGNFPPGAGIVKGTAIVPLTRSQAVWFQRSEKHKVNGTIHQRQQVHYL